MKDNEKYSLKEMTWKFITSRVQKQSRKIITFTHASILSNDLKHHTVISSRVIASQTDNIVF